MIVEHDDGEGRGGGGGRENGAEHKERAHIYRVFPFD